MAGDAVRSTLALSGRYERLLDTIRPKAVMQVVHYSYRNMVMTPLAKARSIPVVELQHGLIGPTHMAYNMAPGRRPEGFPDYLLLFGSWWRENTPGLPLPEERTPAVGFARLEDVRSSHERGARQGPHVVLFVSQGAVGDKLSRIAAELAARLDPALFRVIYRLHPTEMATWRRRYPWLASAPLEVHDRPGESIYSLFTRAGSQVGVYSTALVEGLAFGLRTYLVTLPGHEDLEPLAARGLVGLVDDAGALGEALASEVGPPSDRDLASIWKPGARGQFAAFLSELLD
jgi:hypothetical protein